MKKFIFIIIILVFAINVVAIGEVVVPCDQANSKSYCYSGANIFYKDATASYAGAKMSLAGNLEVNGGTFLWTWGDMAADEIAQSQVTKEQWEWATFSGCSKVNQCTKTNFDAKKTFNTQSGSSVDQSSYDTVSLNCPDNTVVKGLILNYKENQFLNGVQLVCVNRNNQNEQTASIKAGTSDQSFKLLRCPDSKLMTGYRLLRTTNDIFSLRLECDSSLTDSIEFNIKDPTNDAKVDATTCDLLSSLTNLAVNVQKSDSKLIEFALDESSCSSAGPQNKVACDNLKIGVIGASNVVRGNTGGTGWIQQLRLKCPTSTFIVSATGGYSSQKQYDNNFPKLKSKTNNLKDLDLLIISPSGNNIPNQDNPPYCFREKAAVTPVTLMAKEAKAAGVKKVVLFNVNSRDNKQKACVKPYNDRLSQVVQTDSNIDQLIDIYSLLDDPLNPGTCKYCSSADQLHWRIPDGQNIVASEVYSKVFQGGTLTAGGSKSGVTKAKTPNSKTFSSVNFQGTDSEREIDEVWNRISKSVGKHNGEVYYQNKWQPYLAVYGSGVPTSGGSSPAPPSSPSTGAAIGGGKDWSYTTVATKSTNNVPQYPTDLKVNKKYAREAILLPEPTTVPTGAPTFSNVRMTKYFTASCDDLCGGLSVEDCQKSDKWAKGKTGGSFCKTTNKGVYEQAQCQGSIVCGGKMYSYTQVFGIAPYLGTASKFVNGGTASSTDATVGRTIAINPTSGTNCYIPYGSRVYIKYKDKTGGTVIDSFTNNGWYIAEDTGGAFGGNCKIDVYAGVGNAALSAFSTKDYADVWVYPPVSLKSSPLVSASSTQKLTTKGFSDKASQHTKLKSVFGEKTSSSNTLKLTKVKVPGGTNWFSSGVSVSSKYASEALQAAMKELGQYYAANNVEPYRVFYGNSATPRTNGLSCSSLHPGGLAWDINPGENPHCPNAAGVPYTTKVTWYGRHPSKEEYERCARGEIVTTLPNYFINIMEKHGWYWGGRFSKPDSMHFEFIPQYYLQIVKGLPESEAKKDNACIRSFGTSIPNYVKTTEDTLNKNPIKNYNKDLNGVNSYQGNPAIV